MTIQEDIVTALAGVAGDRVYPHAVPQDATRPCVVFRKIGSDPLMTLRGYGGMTKTTFIFDCWADTYAAAIDLAEDVRTAIEAAAALPIKFRELGDPDDYESAVDAYVEPVLFSFWHA